MDETDDKIIELLKKNSRASFVDIGKKMGVTEGAIRSRVNKLVDNGVIRQFTLRTASRNVKAIVEVKIRVNTNTSNVAERIMKIRGVETVYEVSGDDDIVAVIDVISTEELNTVIEEIRRFSDTLSTKTRLILKED
jgi:Lrp/AsnC family transcriptional regulator for asnA, asnC and gidA